MNQDKSNIAVFSFAYYPFESGAEIAAREVIKRLDSFDFTIFTYKFNRNWLSRERMVNAEIFRVGKGNLSGKVYGLLTDKIFYIFRAINEAENLHQKKRFDVIWAVMASYGGIAALFFKLKHPRIPLLLTIQEGDSERHMVFGKFGLVGFFGKRIIQNADYIQVISNYLKDFIKKRGAAAPIEVIPNGVNLELFSVKYRPFELKAVRENLGIKDEYVLITTSRLVYKNAVDVLIDAVAECKNKMLNIKCLVIGDGPERAKLEARSKKLKVDNSIIFLGQIPQQDLSLYLKISDIFVRPSRSEGLGSSFLEAMAAGLPIIGTPVGGIVDFLKDGETGFYTKVDDPKDLANKIFQALKDPVLRKRIISNSQLLIKENYSWDKIALSFKNIFDKLINF